VLSILKSALGQVEREAWVRFFIAVAGLSLAFAAAIFSTVFRQEGNVVATAVSASLALLIAGGVAVTSVPYLARRVAIARMRDAFDYDITREGMVYLGVALAIGVAALNTGNNLLFIVVAALLSGVLVSGVASAGVLRGLQLEISLPAHVFAGKSVISRLKLTNTRLGAPSFSISVAPPRRKRAGAKRRWQRGVWAFPPGPPEKQWLRFPDLVWKKLPESPDPGRIFAGSVYFPYIPARGQATAEVELKFPHRGRYVQEGFGVATRFPFSFLVKTRRMALRKEVLVYPSVEPMDEFFEILPMITGEFEAFVRGRGYDLYRIREYLPEDSARHVDWKATAKSGALKVREFTREDERKLRIVFDNPAPSSGVVPQAYERAVALAASLAWHFATEDTDLSFAAPGYRGAPDIYDFLAYLALVEVQEGGSLLETLQVTDDYNVILTAQPRGSIPTALWACSYFVFIENPGESGG
jgi:uncharacterized protein (DUF58 family)